MIKLTNAYSVREQIRDAGGVFDAPTKSWLVTEEMLAALDAKITPAYGRKISREWNHVVRTSVVA